MHALQTREHDAGDGAGIRGEVIAMWTAVVGIDASTGADRALRWAVDLARHRGGGVTAVHAYVTPEGLGSATAEQVSTESQQRAEKIADQALADLGDVDVPVKREVRPVREGNVAKALLDAGEGADLLVSASRGVGGFFGLVIGSVSMQLLSNASGAVAIVPGPERGAEPLGEGGHVLVGFDGSDHAAPALDWAVQEVQVSGGTVVVLYADPDPKPHGRDRVMEQARQRIPDGVAVEEQPLTGTPAEVLINRSSEARTVVLGSRGRGGFAGMLLGSVGMQVAQYAQCPTVVVHDRK
ncbi:universal stress protein [Egibacter rhizosphaerae]|uniref:universal stress protein n=1 Tax=Egibacter rhizosphaerae TaxID=1670831 RepID=UPI0013F155BD|nr:universal stress protein [Egibacter rhizosphaerae]